MLTGGAEMGITPLSVAGFNASKALSTRNDSPETASRPWDKDRDGFVVGEGAGCLMLEELAHAKKSGAKIYAEMLGFGMSADAYHMTAPPETAEGAILSMKNAIEDAKINSSEIQYINAHGTSTPVGDLAETKAIKEVFGHDASKCIISSTKSVTGHLLGASGSIEAIFSILALRDDLAPPTLNLDNPSDNCKGINLIPKEAIQNENKYVLSNSFGFGGTNVSLIFKKI